MTPLGLFLVSVLVIGGYGVSQEYPEAVPSLTVEKNAETGLTDISVYDKTVSVDIQPLDYSKLND